MSSVSATKGVLEMDDVVLCARARTAIQEGRLPARPPDRTWGGPGVGAACAICDLAVGRHSMEFELQFAIDGHSPHIDVYHVHTSCYAAWEVERARPAS